MRNKWVAWSMPVVIAGLLGWANLSLAQEKKAEPPKKEEPKKVEPKKEEPKKEMPAEKNVLDAAKDAKCAEFCKLVESAGLVEELKGKGPFTVFCPTDEAFNKLGKAKCDELMKPEKKAELKKILLNHVVKGKHLAADVKKMKDAKTESGTVKIEEKDGNWMFGAAKITKTDVNANNGVIHLIDAVVMPAEKEGGKG